MKKRRSRTLLWTFFLLYALLMLYLLFGQRRGRHIGAGYAVSLREDLNLVPFHTIRQYAGFWVRGIRDGSRPYVRLAVVNLLGNIGMFVPLRLFLPLLLF